MFPNLTQINFFGKATEKLYYMGMTQFSPEFWTFIIVAALWTIPWKGVALWKSARRKEIWWFVILLVVNTMGILEILYIFIFSEWKKLKDKKS